MCSTACGENSQLYKLGRGMRPHTRVLPPGFEHSDICTAHKKIKQHCLRKACYVYTHTGTTQSTITLQYHKIDLQPRSLHNLHYYS